MLFLYILLALLNIVFAIAIANTITTRLEETIFKVVIILVNLSASAILIIKIIEKAKG